MSVSTSVSSHNIFIFSWIPNLVKADLFTSYSSLTLNYSFSLTSHVQSVTKVPWILSLSLSLWDPWLSHSFPAPQKASSLSWVMPERSICSPDFQAAHLVLHITSNPDLFVQSYFKLFGGSPQGALQRATKLFSLPQPTSTYCSAFHCRCIYHALVYVSTVSSECSFIPWSPLPKNHTHLTRPRPYHLK